MDFPFREQKSHQDTNQERELKFRSQRGCLESNEIIWGYFVLLLLFPIGNLDW